MATGTIKQEKLTFFPKFANFLVTLNSNKSSAVLRLDEKWEEFVNAVKIAGSNLDFITFIGFIQLPAYNGGSNFGVWLVWGALNPYNYNGVVFLTHYGNLTGFWMMKKGGLSEDGVITQII